LVFVPLAYDHRTSILIVNTSLLARFFSSRWIYSADRIDN